MGNYTLINYLFTFGYYVYVGGTGKQGIVCTSAGKLYNGPSRPRKSDGEQSEKFLATALFGKTAAISTTSSTPSGNAMPINRNPTTRITGGVFQI